MKKNLLAILLGVFPIVCLAKAPNCFSWPMSMTEVWMKNTGIVDIRDLDESKTKITLMVTEKKGRIYILKFIILFFMINIIILMR
ncbi:MAG: hypothetical protein J6568_00880 [Snodgrassella sp.]|nr:hypothetical protein [Snodgrassella sp.]